ncbi:MAG: sigma-70 family RNA polymerase sigma factor [Candidatus Latescibacteria bacterium]|nr:sigma-70 family RNA polymerase sigma factor [Candidatus Latescibacterota bacterium]
MDRQSEAKQVDEALAGRQQAYAWLVGQYQNYAYGVAVGILADFELAQDVVQEAFLCAYRDLAKLRQPDRFGAWLGGIVRHLAHGALRERAQVRRLAEEMRHLAEPYDQPQESRAEEWAPKPLLRRALQRLNPQQREVISLYFVGDLSYAQIARFLQLKETTVKGRLQHARAKLRQEFKMVEEQLTGAELPDDFTAAVQGLLDQALHRDQRQQAIAELAALGGPAVDPLCEALEDRRQWVRYAAALALCAIGDERAAQPVLRLLYAPDFVMHFNEMPRLLAIPGMTEILLKLAQRGVDEQHRRRAILCLRGATGDEDVFAALYKLFGDERESVDLRRTAMQSLCDIRPERAVAIIEEALEGRVPGLRKYALTIAGGEGRLPPLPVCRRIFSEESGWMVRLRAARLLCEHGPAGEEALQTILRHGPLDQRLMAALFLAHLGSVPAQQVLRQELLGAGLDEGAWQAWLDCSSEGRYDPAAVGALLANISTNKRQHHLMAQLCLQMRALCRRDPLQMGPLVEGFLQSGGHPGSQVVATRVLARQRGEDFLGQLRSCLGGQLQRPQKGKAARRAFWEMYRMGEKALPVAEEMFNAENWLERKAAVALLRRWGRLTSQQRRQAQDDPHPAVRLAAQAGE